MAEKWYKQFWPWFLITIPAISMVLGFTIVYLAVTSENSMVSDDYYKEGKAINQSISKKRMAKQLNLVAALTLQENRIYVTFQQALPPDAAALKLDFFHATLQDKDFFVMLTRNAEGVYSGELRNETKGKWRLTLTPFDESWKIRKTVSLPIASDIILEP
ncbi:FixH family protein [Planctobacterium marinum]|uniref:FixH family protein n=1 Tax=Planctobacterium marinum TaxID=1631968 RepID=UPI001E3C39C0|nr:FixH family protein [Planctobacterium marinum]MCC2604009.1 FixH family protein [Planctobacterium marinum]